MEKIECPRCDTDKWQYWVIFGPKSEYMCLNCKMKIKHQVDYEYEWQTKKIWAGVKSTPAKGTYPYEENN